MFILLYLFITICLFIFIIYYYLFLLNIIFIYYYYLFDYILIFDNRNVIQNFIEFYIRDAWGPEAILCNANHFGKKKKKSENVLPKAIYK